MRLSDVSHIRVITAFREGYNYSVKIHDNGTYTHTYRAINYPLVTIPYLGVLPTSRYIFWERAKHIKIDESGIDWLTMAERMRDAK
jgi:hypothetical protein